MIKKENDGVNKLTLIPGIITGKANGNSYINDPKMTRKSWLSFTMELYRF